MSENEVNCPKQKDTEIIEKINTIENEAQNLIEEKNLENNNSIILKDNNQKDHLDLFNNSMNNLNVSKIENKFEENILDMLIEKTSFSWEHFKIVFLLMIYMTGDGFVMIGISLLIPVIANPWNLTDFQKGFIGGSVFLGFTLGAATSGFVSDEKGRKVSFVIGNIVSLIGGVIGFLFSDSIVQISISNFFVGFGLGIGIPAIFSLCSEVLNSTIRSIIIGWIFSFFVVGEILACIVAMKLEMYDYKNSHWKLLLFYRCFFVSLN